MAGRNGIPGIQQMRRIHGDIATCGFNITGTVNDFAVCRTAAVLLYPQTVAGQDITMLVMQTVCKQLQVIPRINQRTVQQVPATFIVRLPAVPVKPLMVISLRLFRLTSPPA